MEWLSELHHTLYAKMGNTLYYAIGFVTIIALLAQWRLYEKCRLPGLAAFVPGGPLVLLSGRDGRLIDVDAGGIRRVTRFEFGGRNPVGVVPAANTGHFGVLDVAGQVTVYRVPST